MRKDYVDLLEGLRIVGYLAHSDTHLHFDFLVSFSRSNREEFVGLLVVVYLVYKLWLCLAFIWLHY
jgi:hypothetical protein